MTYAERFADKEPIGVLSLTQCGGLVIMETDPWGEWAIVAWNDGEKFSGFYRHKLTYDPKMEAHYFYKGGRKWYLSQFISIWRG